MRGSHSACERPEDTSKSRGSARVNTGSVLLLLLLLANIPAAIAQQGMVPGKVVALSNTVVEVYSPAAGRILSARERPLMVGDLVKKGDPLAIIEHRYNLHDASHISNARWDFLSAMLEARGSAVAARIEREKAERLLKIGTVSGRDVQALRAAEQVAQAEYEKRKVLLDQQDEQIRGTDMVRRPLLSPIDGDISVANFTQGQVVEEGVLLYRVVNLKEVGVLARLGEADYRKLQPQTTAKLRFANLPDRVYTGRLEAAPPVIDPQSRTWDVLFRVENPGERLRFGMIGQMELAP